MGNFKHIHIVLPSRVSINWLTPWLEIASDLYTSITYQIIDQNQTFSGLNSLLLKFILWLEIKYYKKGQVKFTGFDVTQIVKEVKTMQCKKNPTGCQVIDFTSHTSSSRSTINIGSLSWNDHVHNILGYLILNREVTDVIWYKDNKISTISHIQNKGTLVDQIKGYYNKLALDTLSIDITANMQENELSNEKWKTLDLYKSLKRRFGGRKKVKKWTLASRINNDDWHHFKPDNEDYIWADPFMIYNNDQYYVFYEEMKPGGKGEICVGIIENNNLTCLGTILEGSTHFSYPFVFEHDGCWYMIPENAEAKEVAIYKLNLDQLKADKVSVILEGMEVYDPTVYNHQGVWYLFGNRRINDLNTFNDDLHIYYSENLFSNKWKSHPENPVIKDVRRSRPAGTIIKDRAMIIRPSQDCGLYYGRRVVFNEIDELTTTKYREHLIDQLEPLEGYHGAHTYHKCNRVEIIDLLEIR